MIRVGVNGFGRIGRNCLPGGSRVEGAREGHRDRRRQRHRARGLARALAQVRLGLQEAGHGCARPRDRCVTVGTHRFEVTQCKDPGEIPWKKLGADVVIESTGLFTEREKAAKHIAAGARKVVVSAPAKEPDVTVVLGVNFDIYDKAKHNVISMGIVHDGQPRAAREGAQRQVRHREGHDDHQSTHTPATRSSSTRRTRTSDGRGPRRCRSYPLVHGRRQGHRRGHARAQGQDERSRAAGPDPVGSITDLSFMSKTEVTAEDVNKALKEAADGPMKGIMEFCTDPIVSADVVGDPHSERHRLAVDDGRRRQGQPRQGARPGTTTNGATRTGSSSSVPKLF